MIPYEKTTDICLKKMFKMVCEKYPNKELTDQDDWYQQRTWTKEQEDKFRVWMKKLLKRRYDWTDRMITKEIGMFLLMWGWKVDQT